MPLGHALPANFAGQVFHRRLASWASRRYNPCFSRFDFALPPKAHDYFPPGEGSILLRRTMVSVPALEPLSSIMVKLTDSN